ncbi:MAG: hypothetical protein LBV26_01095 [Bacteroidales bacterium]|jgi:hypothetical protein|nr:hypothetical protein [Bacteroidales bacterium]
MKKKFAILLSIILALAVAGLGYVLFKSSSGIITDPYRAISQSAGFIIETADLKSFVNSILDGRGLAGELKNIKEFKPAVEKLEFLSAQFNKPGFKNIATERSVAISFHTDNDNRLAPLVSVSVPESFRQRHLAGMLREAGAVNIIEVKGRVCNILKAPYRFHDSNDTLYLALIEGLALCSTSWRIINNAADVIKTGDDIKNSAAFAKVFPASGKKSDKVFVIFKNIKPVIGSLYSDAGRHIAQKVERLAGAAAADIVFTDDGSIILNGYTETDDSRNILTRFKNIAAKELSTPGILPSSTVMFETSVMDSKHEMPREREEHNYTNLLATQLYPFLGNEITRVILNIKGSDNGENTLVVYSLTDRQQAQRLFENELKGRYETFYFNPDDVTRTPVYNIRLNGLADLVQHGFAPDAEETFAAFYDSYMVTGSSYAAVARMLYDNMLNKTLANDIAYRKFENAMPSTSGYYVYCSPSEITGYLNRFIDSSLAVSIKNNSASVGKIQSAGYQLSAGNGMIYNSMSINFGESQTEEPATEWETLLDTIAAIKPFFFTNHVTGAREIFIQDMKNNAYLINAAGRVLWKVQLRERINGTVYMVDYFRNGKLQLLFAGRNYLHILDRNGNYVDRHPVKLRSPATNNLALFDYDNNKNYRLFISGEDKQVYCYDIRGNTVKGWKPFRTADSVVAEVNYFRVSGKDYIVVADKTLLYFLDRTGNVRLNTREPVTRAKGSTLKLNAGEKPSVVCTAPDGTVQHIYFDGTITKFNIRSFQPGHSFDIFDTDGDGRNEYLFVEGGSLYVYGGNGSEIFSRNFETSQLVGPLTFTFSQEDRKTGVFDTDKNLIYLIEKNGETASGFPLKGASMFSIGRLFDRNEWHLIVGGSNRFLYNYNISSN